jgi:energy-converting hydrogenase Eha subunit H
MINLILTLVSVNDTDLIQQVRQRRNIEIAFQQGRDQAMVSIGLIQ